MLLNINYLSPPGVGVTALTVNLLLWFRLERPGIPECSSVPDCSRLPGPARQAQWQNSRALFSQAMGGLEVAVQAVTGRDSGSCHLYACTEGSSRHSGRMHRQGEGPSPSRSSGSPTSQLPHDAITRASHTAILTARRSGKLSILAE